MTAEQFAYWLQGFSELNEGVPSEAQWAAIKDHLQQVFVKVTKPTLSARAFLQGVPHCGGAGQANDSPNAILTC